MGDGTTDLLMGPISQIQAYRGHKSTSVYRGFKCSLIHTQSLAWTHVSQSAHLDILILHAATLKMISWSSTALQSRRDRCPSCLKTRSSVSLKCDSDILNMESRTSKNEQIVNVSQNYRRRVSSLSASQIAVCGLNFSSC